MIEAVVVFAPVPQLLDAQLREVLVAQPRGEYRDGWQLRRGRSVPAELVRTWAAQRRRFELSQPLAERWQVRRLLEVAGTDPRLVHLHDLAEALAAPDQGQVAASMPSAVAAESVEMVARLTGQLDDQPGAGCQVSRGGRVVWSASGLGRDVALSDDGRLVLARAGWLELDGEALASWRVAADGVEALVRTDGGHRQIQVVGPVARSLRSLAPGGADQVEAVAHDQAVGEVVAGLAEALADAVRFSRTMLLVDTAGAEQAAR